MAERSSEPPSLPEIVEERLGVTNGQIFDFGRRWQLTELALFGSILRDDSAPTVT
jgi:predicted nucleotidyltransferase